MARNFPFRDAGAAFYEHTPVVRLVARGDDFLPAYRPVQCVDQRLNFDEFGSCPLSLVPIKGRREHFRMRITILDHALTSFAQYSKSLVHLVPLLRSHHAGRFGRLNQPCIAFNSVEILMVAKLENVSDTA
jgi:hypothetical protein